MTNGVRPSRAQQYRKAGHGKIQPLVDTLCVAAPGDGRTPVQGFTLPIHWTFGAGRVFSPPAKQLARRNRIILMHEMKSPLSLYAAKPFRLQSALFIALVSLAITSVAAETNSTVAGVTNSTA